MVVNSNNVYSLSYLKGFVHKKPLAAIPVYESYVNRCNRKTRDREPYLSVSCVNTTVVLYLNMKKDRVRCIDTYFKNLKNVMIRG